MAVKKPKLKVTKPVKRTRIAVKPTAKKKAAPSKKVVRRKKATAESPAPEARQTPHVTRRPEEDPGILKFVVMQPDVPEMPPAPEFEDLGELPESYGTNRVYLVARDPYWFYAYWDISRERLAEAREAARDGQIFLQVCETNGACVQQIMVPGEARNWFIYAGRPGIELFAELGYFNSEGIFETIGRSPVGRAPKDTPSTDLSARFVTIPMSLSFQQLLELVSGERFEGEGLAETLARLQERGFEFPFDVGHGGNLSAEAREILFRQFVSEFSRRYWVGSMELAQRWQRTERVGASVPGVPFGASFGASPMGGPAWSGTIPRRA